VRGLSLNKDNYLRIILYKMTTPNDNNPYHPYHKIAPDEPVERMLSSLVMNKDINLYLKTGDVYKKINKFFDFDEKKFIFRKEDGGPQMRPIDNLYYAWKQDGGKSRRIRKRRQQTKRRSLRRRGVNKRR
jgi:hypothetical protein